jgi:hypothetical protein
MEVLRKNIPCKKLLPFNKRRYNHILQDVKALSSESFYFQISGHREREARDGSKIEAMDGFDRGSGGRHIEHKIFGPINPIAMIKSAGK